MDTNKRLWMNRICVWFLWSSLLMKALVLVDADGMKSRDAGSPTVVAYWERRLHAAMPGSIRNMVTPLSEEQATQLLVGSKDLLPSSATLFCKAAHIKCGHQISEGQPDSELPLQSPHQPKSRLQLPFYVEEADSGSQVPQDHLQIKLQLPFFYVDLGEQANPSNDFPEDHQKAKIKLPFFYEHPMEQADSRSQVPQDHPQAKLQLSFFYVDLAEQANPSNDLPQDHSKVKTKLPFFYEHPMEQVDSGSQVPQDHLQVKLQLPFFYVDLGEQAHPSNDFSQDHQKANIKLPFFYEHPMEQADSGSQVPQYHPQAKLQLPFFYVDLGEQANPSNDLPQDHSKVKTKLPFFYEHPMEQADSGSQVPQDHPQAKLQLPFFYVDLGEQANPTNDFPQNHQKAKIILPFFYEHPMEQADSGSQVPQDHSQAKLQVPFFYVHLGKQANPSNDLFEDHPNVKKKLPFFYTYPEDEHDSKNYLHHHHHKDLLHLPRSSQEQPYREGHSEAMPHIPRKQVGSGKGHHLLVSHSVEEVELFFLPKVLEPGRDLYLKVANGAQVDDERVFLPRKLAKLFPIDTPGDEVKMESMLGISLNGLARTSLDMCESKNIHSGEAKACPTSVEELVDFVSDVLMDVGNVTSSRNGVMVKAHESLSNASNFRFAGKRYRVVDVQALKEDLEEPSVVCHDIQGVPFRTFYCHKVPHSQSFVVALRAEEDGSIHERIVNCHHDTSYWNPQHLAFQLLGFKPGEGSACHFLGLSWSVVDAWLLLRA